MSDPDWTSVTGQANPLQRHSKLELATLMTVLRGFAYGLSISSTARAAGLTSKSVRELYVQLRSRLQDDRFAKWHRANRKLLTISDPDIESAIRSDFFDVLARCSGNETCFRNFRDGKRRIRLCQKCALPEYLGDKTQIEDALEFFDAIRAFYKRIGIAGEDRTRPDIFRLRAIHTVTILAAADGTPKTKDGDFVFAKRAPLSFRTLLETLVADLADNPLGT